MSGPNQKEQAPPPETEYPETTGYLEEDEEVSLTDLFGRLYSYRVPITTVVIAVGVLYMIMSLLLLLLMPVHRTATLLFHLDFEGVGRGEYPNGMKFSSAEIVSTPVLTKVFDVNNLEQHLTLQDFSDSIFVLESNLSIQLLDQEYQAKLSDPKILLVDRRLLEEEYRAKREALKVSDFSLNFLQHETRRSIPKRLASKVLMDILSTWAEDMAQRKGALKYRQAVYSRNFVRKDFIEAEDYLIGVDILRSKINQLLANIREVSQIPGARVMRVGKKRISLAEVEANLRDSLNFKLRPLISLIRSSAVSKDPESSELYFEDRLFEIQLERKESDQRISTLQSALEGYLREKGPLSRPQPGEGRGTGFLDPSTPALIPQFGSSFLDRLVEISTEGNDLEFRQDITERVIAEGLKKASLDRETAHYQELLRTMRGISKRTFNKAVVGQVESRSDALLNDLFRTLDQLQLIYQELSAQNLNPRTMLYDILKPGNVSTERSIPLKTLGLYGAILLLLTFFITVLGCFLHSSFRSRPADVVPETVPRTTK